MYINEIVKGKRVNFIKGDFKNGFGTFKSIVGYNDKYGCVCKIDINGEQREFTSDFFEFVNPIIAKKWEDDSYNFVLE